MLKKILNIYQKYKEIVNYLIFGVLATIVSLGVKYALLFTLFDASNAVQLQISVILSWIAAVLFAYFTNRKLVFNSKAITLKENIQEFGKFILGRAFTMVIEIIGVFLLNNVIE